MGLFGLDFLNTLSYPSRKLSSALAFDVKETLPTNYALAAGTPLPVQNEWNKHVLYNEDLKDKYMQMYGGWNRKQRDAKGYHSGMDVGMRYPNNIDDLKILGALYQLLDAGTSLFSPDVKHPIKDNFYDYKANLEGLKAASKTKKKRTPAIERQMEEMATRYADPFGDTTK